MEQLTFRDLNPTVAGGDEYRLSQQVRKLYGVLKYYKAHNLRATNVVLLNEIGQRFGARVHELRTWLIKYRSMSIDTHYEAGGVSWYELMPIDESEYYQKRRDKLDAIREIR